ncbi:MAG: protein kinase [Alphaproteobacteria bacterium]|nr:protein kinase [Alphaproteobacteria bacterium]MCB9696503.1 protein kinase [Alphaproteobacteria bacterium]
MTTMLPARRRMTLLREVGETPLAALYAAELRRAGGAGLVAVKVLTGFTDHRPAALEEVAPLRRRELEQLGAMRDLARRLGRIDHPHVVAATDLAQVEGRPALVSPWIDGIDLLDWVEFLRETDRVLPARVVCDLLRGVASALDAALNRAPWGEEEPLGLVHRDVKPSNVMVSRDGQVKVLDFGTGFTSLAGRDARSLVRRAGLSRYLSPGRRQGKRGGPESDVYALGILGVELLRGAWLHKVLDQNPAHDRHLAEVVALLPDLGLRSAADDQALRSLLLRMIAWDADARPTAGGVAQTLRVLADRSPGPGLESFAHDHALPWLHPPDAEDGMPTASVVEPADLLAAPAIETGPVQLETSQSESAEPRAIVLPPAPTPPVPSPVRRWPAVLGAAGVAALISGVLGLGIGLVAGWLLGLLG